jgi:serine/threonine-protein kinase
MNEPSDLNHTVDDAASDPLEAGLAAAFGADSGPPLPATGSVVQALGAPAVRLREPDTEPAADPDPAGRLQLGGEIDHGGMAVVLRGHDADLGRDVAVKVLLEAHAGRTELVARFVEEAQVAGQLQHPGVVPVYDLGVLPDRRPYFTMKLVKGQNLARLLAERTPGADTPGSPAERPRFLAIFLQVCQAVAYAHSKGVVHRDLKPRNIMVGAFGEVQVMDWGLAKVLGEGGAPAGGGPPPQDLSVIHTARGGADTQAGSVLGTYAYMPPEQALGEVGRLDRRADVFALGALLCEVLTGRPPYTGEDPEAVRRRAARADLADALARLDGCGADPELVALCQRCLAAEPAGRPRDAGVLAAELAAYLEGVEARLRKAEVEREKAAATAAVERRARRLTVGLAASVIALLLLGGGGWFWAERARVEREAEATRAAQEWERKVNAQLNEARQLRERARQARPDDRPRLAREALAAAERTDALLAEGDGDPALRNQVSRFLAELRQEEQERQAAERDRRMLDRLAQIRLGQTVVEDNSFSEDRADPEYLAAFRDYGIDIETMPTREAAKRIGGRPIRKELVAALDDWLMIRRLLTRQNEPALWKPVAELARAVDHDPWRNRLRDAMLSPTPDPALLRQLSKTADCAAQPPESLYNLYLMLARFDAVESAVLLRKAQQHHLDAFWINSALADIFKQGHGTPRRLDEALRFSAAALASSPLSPGAHYNVGLVLTELGRDDEALAAFDSAIRLKEDYAQAHDHRGTILAQKGQYDEALKAAHKSLAIKKRAAPWVHIASGYDKQGKLAEAERACREAIKLEPDMPIAHFNLGLCLRKQDRLPEAEVAYRTALDRLDDFLTSGKPMTYKQARRLAIRLPKDYVLVCNDLGLLLLKKGRPQEALEVIDKGLKQAPTAAALHFNRGSALFVLKRTEEAAEAFRTTIRHQPDHSQAYINLGVLYHEQGRLPDAATAFARALDINPKLMDVATNLAEMLEQIKQFGPAAEAWKRALRALPEGDRRRPLFEQRLRQDTRYALLQRQWPALLRGELKPAGAAEWVERARFAQRVLGTNLGAARVWKRAFADRPELAGDATKTYRFEASRAAALAGCGKGADLAWLDDEDRPRWRKQSLEWLRADLAELAKFLEEGKPEQRAVVPVALRQWRGSADLAGVRDAGALAKLPAGERQAWRALWADVDALLRKAKGKE